MDAPLPSQPSMKGARVPPGHLLANLKLQGSMLAKCIQGSGIGIVFDNALGVVDFYVSGSCGVIFLREEELVQGNDVIFLRINKFCYAKGGFRGIVLAEVTNTSKQYHKELQLKTISNTQMSVIPVASEEEAVKILHQLVHCSSHANPLVSTPPKVQWDEVLLSVVQSFPGVGQKKAKDLLLTFKSIEGLHKASEHEISAIIGKKAAVVLKRFLSPS